MKAFEIINRGNKLLEEIKTWMANEGLDAEEATTETAQTLEDLGAIVATLLDGGLISEEVIIDAITEGVNKMMAEEYDRW